MTEKRFILTEQFNGLQGVTFVKDDCADVDTYYTVDGTVDLLNQLSEENEQLKKVLGAILLEVKRDISNTNQTGEIKVFINPNSFELISEVLRKYGALKEWYDD